MRHAIRNDPSPPWALNPVLICDSFMRISCERRSRAAPRRTTHNAQRPVARQ